MVPTVERGLRDVDFWSIETAGERPSMKSTSGLSIWPRNCRAYADSDSTYRRWPSAKIVSKARLDLPDPDSPVNTIRASRGRSRWTSLRLCSRAPRTTRRSNVIPVGQPGRPVAPGPRWRCRDVDTCNAVTTRAQSVTMATLPRGGGAQLRAGDEAPAGSNTGA